MRVLQAEDTRFVEEVGYFFVGETDVQEFDDNLGFAIDVFAQVDIAEVPPVQASGPGCSCRSVDRSCLSCWLPHRNAMSTTTWNVGGRNSTRCPRNNWVDVFIVEDG